MLTWSYLSRIDNIDAMDIFTHGADGEPEIVGGKDSAFWIDGILNGKAIAVPGKGKIVPAQLNYANNAYVVFHGCTTASYADLFADAQNVTTYGQKYKSNFSDNMFFRLPSNYIDDETENVYLFDYEGGNPLQEGRGYINYDLLGEKHEPQN